MEPVATNWQTIFLAIMTGLSATVTCCMPVLIIILAKVKTTSDATHVLVNSRMGDQLRLSMIQAKRLWLMTKDDDDKKAFELAERLYNEHQERQNTLDAI